MISVDLAGSMMVNPTTSDAEGERIIVVEAAPAQRYLIGPIPAEVAKALGERLLMSDEQLKETLTREEREQEAVKKLHLPPGMERNGVPHQ